MSIFLLVAAYGLWRSLRVDYATEGIPEKEKLQETVDDSKKDTKSKPN